MSRTCLAVCIAVLVSLGGGACAVGWTPSNLYAPNGDYLTVAPSYSEDSGLYTYLYDVTNTTLSDNVISFTLVFPWSVQVTGFSDLNSLAPTGWTPTVTRFDGGSYKINKVNWSVEDDTNAIAPTATKTFGFTCKYSPSASLEASASSRGALGYSGSTYGPVPEPAGLAVLAVGLSGLLSLRFRKRAA